MDIDPAYVRRLEDAVAALWAEMDVVLIEDFERTTPRLVAFIRDIYRNMPHEERMMRLNVWMEDGAPND